MAQWSGKRSFIKLPETILILNVTKLKQLTYRWQKPLVLQERNGKHLILPLFLNPVCTQGQEKSLKPSPCTRRTSCELLAEGSSANILQAALLRDLRLDQSSLSCSISHCLLRRDPLFWGCGLKLSWRLQIWGKLRESDLLPLQENNHLPRTEVAVQCLGVSRCSPLSAHVDLSLEGDSSRNQASNQQITLKIYFLLFKK